MRFVLLLVAGMSLFADEKASLTDFSFLSGAWRGEMHGMLIEEHWMKPEGDAMLGMYRIAKDGKTRMTELCAIEKRENGIVLLLRHFNPGLMGREEKDSPLAFPLERTAPHEAAFAQGGTRLTYRRVDPKTLIVVLEKEVGGKTSKDEFRYSRME